MDTSNYVNAKPKPLKKIVAIVVIALLVIIIAFNSFTIIIAFNS